MSSPNIFLETLKKTTGARIGIGRAGLRYPTSAHLKFKQDLATSRDAVRKNVSDDWVKKLGFLRLSSQATTRTEYLMNIQMGRNLSAESLKTLKSQLPHSSPDIVIICSDGLSSLAFENNVPQMLELMRTHVSDFGLTIFPPLYIDRARVAIIDQIGEILKPKAAIILLGERPGLGTADSLSAYFEYSPCLERVESDRNVLSNIHLNGIPPTEAALMLAEALHHIIQIKKSGMSVRFEFT